MVAIILMSVVVHSAGSVIVHMCRYNEHHGWQQQPQFVGMYHLFYKKQANSDTEKNEGFETVMMPFEPMTQGNGSNDKGKQNHAQFKLLVFYDFNSKNRQTGH